MTTIAYRDGILAADTKVTFGENNAGNVNKIQKITVTDEPSFLGKFFGRKPIKNEYLVGWSGIASDALDFINCLFFKNILDRNDYDATVIVINKEGTILIYDGSSLNGIPFNSPYIAIGSGMAVAQGAMYVGASAAEAVEAAMFHDNNSGGEIQTISFDD